jgi:hypothetical protein
LTSQIAVFKDFHGPGSGSAGYTLKEVQLPPGSRWLQMTLVTLLASQSDSPTLNELIDIQLSPGIWPVKELAVV